ncbi:MAG: AbiH family protein [Rikenellaceae bacterium]
MRHIHGYYDKDMVLGVNDISQIANDELKKEFQITDALVKPRCNQVTKHLVDNTCKRVIANSHLIFIFGSSIGASDKLWWDEIGKKLSSDPNTRLVIFYKDQEIPKRNRGYKLGAIERTVRANFLLMTNLAPEVIKKAENRIFVVHNAGIFNFKLKPKDTTAQQV